MVKVQSGTLVTTDAATIVFLEWLNDTLPVTEKFVVRKLDSHTIFITSALMDYVKKQLADRLLATTFDEEEEAQT